MPLIPVKLIEDVFDAPETAANVQCHRLYVAVEVRDARKS
jgi:hypothetical protein